MDKLTEKEINSIKRMIKVSLSYADPEEIIMLDPKAFEDTTMNIFKSLTKELALNLVEKSETDVKDIKPGDYPDIEFMEFHEFTKRTSLMNFRLREVLDSEDWREEFISTYVTLVEHVDIKIGKYHK